MNSWSPQYQLLHFYKDDQEELPDDWQTQLPDVNRWSDVAWILWLHQAGPVNAGHLKYIFRHNIATEFTREVIGHCFGVDPEIGEIPRWPGRTVRLPDPCFVALLGTPHGKAVVFLLTQHPNELGQVSVLEITLFSVTSRGDFQLLFTLTGL